MPARSSLAALLALGTSALFASPARAQCDQLVFHHGNLVCSPAAISGTYKGAVAGGMAGAWSPEIATIKGSSLIVYHNPDANNDAVVVATDAIDVCYATKTDSSNTPGLFYTAPGGLYRVTFDATPSVNAYVTNLVSSSAYWQNAKIVRASLGVGGGSREGLVGVKADGQTVFSATPSGASEFTGPQTVFTLSVGILDVVLLNYDTNASGVEIAVMHQSGVQIRKQDGTYITGRAGTTPGDAIAAVHGAAAADSLAWVTRAPGGTSNLLVFNPAFSPPQMVSLGSRVYASLAAADLEGDGDDDLVFGAATWNTLEVRDCDPSASSWFGATPWNVHMALDGHTSETVSAMGRVLCANFFNDWDEENQPAPAFAIALPDQDGMRLVPQLELRGELGGTAADFDSAIYRSAAGPDCGVTGSSQWTAGLGGGWGTIGANEIEIVVRKCKENDPTVPEVNAFFTGYIPFSGALDAAAAVFTGAETTAESEETPRRYFVKVRPVFRNTSGNVTQVWRWSILGMAATCDGIEWLWNLPGSREQPPVVLEYQTCSFVEGACDDGQPGSVTRFVPSAVPQSRIPSAGPNTLPGPPH